RSGERQLTKLSKAMEQYLETIYEIEKGGNIANVTDIAAARGVKSPSVTYVLKKLSDLKLVNRERYNREVSLTKKGRMIAQRLERTHQTLRWFFEMIGIDSEVANDDACEIEHIVRPETVDKLTDFVEWVQSTPKAAKYLSEFQSE
ncbi:MAG: metal-dependent transcriptional regulator, partial [Candidatus Thorarchaeota archaeon]